MQSEKCPMFCKCLRYLKSGFAIFSDFAGHKKQKALVARYQRIMMEVYFRVRDTVLVMSGPAGPFCMGCNFRPL